ncbi:DUF6913 domain-containing protein [Carboxylicivirga sp. N1Y90]|uniref:DUF6913 domain-containing protein n=1 Tax=Carboxylicivirga fragile TaxID=3417571 RepID=UPI003D34A7F9|nr:hypothetical protein [Marinilabiliaceae bacterium N1Y90]
MSNIIDTIREKIANFQLQRQLKKQPHKAEIYNLQTAQNAGILFDAENPDNLKIVKTLVNELKEFNIKSSALGYIHKAKRDDNYIGDQQYSYACKKDFSFFYQPKKEVISDFINEPYHLLIVLVDKHLFPIDYIGSLSKARFKAGKTGVNNEMFDFMIELKNGVGLEELKTHTLHYLSIINNK